MYFILPQRFFHLQILCLNLFQRMVIEILFNKKIQILFFEMNLCLYIYIIMIIVCVHY